jgi:hypothetical protein
MEGYWENPQFLDLRCSKVSLTASRHLDTLPEETPINPLTICMAPDPPTELEKSSLARPSNQRDLRQSMRPCPP